jgi:hypothetical protein
MKKIVDEKNVYFYKSIPINKQKISARRLPFVTFHG